MKPDYLKFYNLEKYLMEEVRPRFRDTGHLCSLDLFLIIHWKSPRARKKAKIRLERIVGTGGFQEAARRIASSLRAADGSENRLKILMQNWRFRLPTASAILAVLYPEDFTIYDVRVRGVIAFPRVAEAYSENAWARTWQSYLEYKNRVIEKAPSNLSLRDKDRYFWGKSLSIDIESDLRG